MFQLRYQSNILSRTQTAFPNLEELPDFAQEAFMFCKDWLAGKDKFLQATSGSTGTSKIQEITRQQMEASAKATGAFFGANPEFKLGCCLNPAYIAGKMMLVRAIVWNCEIRLVEPSADPLTTEETSFDMVAMVPLQVEKSLSSLSSLGKLKSIKVVLIGGAPLSDSLQLALSRERIAAWQTFGMTETLSHFALAKIGEGELVYRCLPDVQIGLTEEGTLWVQSPMSGEKKLDTKDKIELRSKNSFIWLGRADFMVNSGGFKLFPEQLEKKISLWMEENYPHIPYFFFGEVEDRLGERLVLYVEGEQSDVNLEMLEGELKKLLGKFEVPKEIYLLPRFAYTPNGKINRPVTAKRI
ncbi:MAG: AMP-binding protein [Bacteroidetes bacterium]|nr:AMP-binding protein [Bacteroidota bacterium]MDA1268297.1 AMP-binding protein [Bacteroidota bacterium]